MGAVINLPTITTVDMQPADVLEKAKGWGMEHCLVIGHNDKGDLQFGGTTSDLEKIVLLLERAKLWCIREIDG